MGHIPDAAVVQPKTNASRPSKGVLAPHAVKKAVRQAAAAAALAQAVMKTAWPCQLWSVQAVLEYANSNDTSPECGQFSQQIK